MNDEQFLKQLDDSFYKQKNEFYTEYSTKTLEYWKSRDFDKERLIEAEKAAADPSYKVKNIDRAEKKRETILRKDAAFQSKPWKVRGGSKRAQEITNITHKISVTQVIDQTKGRTGHQILQILPNNATKEQIIHVIASMRAAVPKGHPAVFTVHKDIKKHNLHIQGWVSTKEWDLKALAWKERPVGEIGKRVFSYFETEAGFKDYQEKCKVALAEAGLRFEHADDKTLPRVTGSHRYVQVLLKERSKADFISGKVKEGVRSEKVRVILDQIGARARAIEDKIQRKDAKSREAFYSLIEEPQIFVHQSQPTNIQRKKPEEPVPSVTSTASDLLRELEQYQAEAEKRVRLRSR
ncbi:MAG: hypothetical protein WCG31_10850 [Deltaproteobacteria bacterium]